MATTHRLAPAARRALLVRAGARAFAATQFSEVRMEDVADDAGVSRALLYRHFPGKAALFAAVYRDAVDQRLRDTAPHAAMPLTEQITSGLEAHIDYFAANRNTVLAANREMAGDPTIQAVIAEEFAVLRDRLLDTPELRTRARDAAGALVMSWLVFVRALCVEWLSSNAFDRGQLRDMCVGALLGALGEPPPARS